MAVLFDLTNKANKANPPPVGSPPICVEAVKMLQNSLDACIEAFRIKPSKILVDQSLCIYQACAYVIAKLKQFNKNISFLTTTTIPLYINLHNQLKSAFVKANLNVPQMPNQPFNFDDPMILKRLRAPPANNIFAVPNQP